MIAIAPKDCSTSNGHSRQLLCAPSQHLILINPWRSLRRGGLEQPSTLGPSWVKVSFTFIGAEVASRSSESSLEIATRASSFWPIVHTGAVPNVASATGGRYVLH